MKRLLLLFSIFTLNSAIAQISDFKSTSFTIADNVAALNKGSNLENLPLLAHKLTYKLPTQVEKFRAIYTWVCTNIEGDYYQHEKVSQKRKKFVNDSLAYIKWNNKYKKIAFNTLVKHKKTMCTGYAYLIKELCFFANIKCEIVDGYGRSITSNVEKLDMLNHSWNAVQLNNKWYLCDATWSSGYTDASNTFIKDYNDGYFLTDPVLFSKNHYPLDKKWLLNDTLIKTQYVASPLVYGETFKHKIVPIEPIEMGVVTSKNNQIQFTFKATKTLRIDTVSLVKFLGDASVELKISELKNKNGTVTFKHLFKRKGFHDVHIKIGNDIVATYVVEVLKENTNI